MRDDEVRRTIQLPVGKERPKLPPGIRLESEGDKCEMTDEPLWNDLKIMEYAWKCVPGNYDGRIAAPVEIAMVKIRDEYEAHIAELKKQWAEQNNKSPVIYGWICPRCQAIHGPFVSGCGCVPRSIGASTANIKISV